MSTQTPPQGTLVGSPEIKQTRALSALPCVKCCRSAARDFRTLLHAVADVTETGRAESDLDGRLVNSLAGLVGFVTSTASEIVVRPAPTHLVPPLPQPIKPWGRGWVALGFIPDSERDLATQMLCSAIARTLRSIATLTLIPDVNDDPSMPGDSCEDCVARSMFGQSKKQERQIATIRRRV